MSSEVLNRLEDEGLIAICIRGADWPRGLLSDAPVPDKWMGLIERPAGRRAFAPAGEAPRLARDDRLLLVRNRPIAVAIGVDSCRAACGHEVRAQAELLVRWPAREDDLAALHRTLMQDDALMVDQLARAVSDGGALSALREFIRVREASELVGRDWREEFAAALEQDPSVRRFLFETGLVIERVTRMDLASETLARQHALAREQQRRVEQIQAREALEQAALAATRRRLDDLAGVLEKLKSLSAADPHLRWHDLLPALSPAERGRLLENLWRLTPDRHTTEAIVVVAGNQVIWIDPAAPERFVRRTGPPEDLGGLRCVDFCPQRRWLLVGAARGVWALDADSGEVRARFEAPVDLSPRTGFNSVLALADRLVATHSSLGCWSFPLESAAEPTAILTPQNGTPRSIRSATALSDGRVVFAADDCLHLWDPGSGELGTLGSADDVIHAVSVLEGGIWVGTRSGRLMQLDLRQPEDWWLAYRLRDPIESLVARRWNDLVELVVPAGRDGVLAVYPEENISARLLDTRIPVRRAWAGDDLLVGLSDARDRLIVMSSLAPDRRGREAPLARLTGHSVQDACLVTARAEPPA